MANTLYKYGHFISLSDSAEFDTIHKPGQSVPHSGIYRCEGCGSAIASNISDPFPPQNHHQHSTGQGEIRWRLIVWA